MTELLRIRDTLRKLYAEYDAYLRPGLKFLFALACILSVNHYLGYRTALLGFLPVLLGALVCALTPPGTTAFVSGLFVLGHLSQASLTAAGFLLFLLILIVGLYLGFRPRTAWLLALIPLCFLWHVPFVVPVVLGLSVGAGAAVPAVCAVPVWFLMRYVHLHAAELTNSTDLSALAASFTSVGRGVFQDHYMYLMILMFVVTILLVSAVRHLSVDHAWTFAVGAGIAAELLIGVFGGQAVSGGDLILDLLGLLLSLLLSLLYEHLFFAVDYRGTEKLQFEDDDYYYYVKAVPKIRPDDEDERRA